MAYLEHFGGVLLRDVSDVSSVDDEDLISWHQLTVKVRYSAFDLTGNAQGSRMNEVKFHT